MKIFSLLFFAAAVRISSAISEAECQLCHNLTVKFNEGLQKTDKHNFGGGNTAWEERKLGTYIRSETRLITILEEHVCGKAKDDYKCHQFVEKHESDIERWWFDVFASDVEIAADSDNVKSLRSFLCVNLLKTCCEANRYGEQCELTCSSATCSDHGTCIVDGTRSLKARKCVCDESTAGSNCERCKTGWFRRDETAAETSGSFSCERCDWRCETCSNEPTNCQRCLSGFQLETSSSKCVDVDECARNATVCAALGAAGAARCENTEGSFRCDCEEGYMLDKPTASDSEWDADEDELPEETEARLSAARRNAATARCAAISEIVKRGGDDVTSLLKDLSVETLRGELGRTETRLHSELMTCLIVLGVWFVVSLCVYVRFGARSMRVLMFLCALLFAFTYRQFTLMGNQADTLERLNSIIESRQPRTVETAWADGDVHDEF